LSAFISLGRRFETGFSKPADALRETIQMPKMDNETILLAFVAVTALAVLLQAILLLAIFVTVRKAARAVREEAEDLRSSLMPIIYNSRDLYSRIAPKIEATVEDLSEIAHGLRVQTEAFQSTAVEVLDRVQRQTSRLDIMFSSVLDAVDRAGGFVAEAVSRPVRQISGMVASIKAIVESLRGAESATRHAHPSGEPSSSDEDRFE
jgi:methyl-accepting chemotaxis protein